MAKRIAQTKQIALEQLTTFPANPRRGDVAAIRASLEATGQYRAIVVRSDTMEVLAGNHTLAAMRELGYEKALCHLVNVDDTEARRIVLADNRTAELASYDEQALADLLAQMDGDLQGTGWDDSALADLLAGLEGDRAGTDTEPMEFAGSGSTVIACENLSRRCYAMEIDPGYCDVIVDRWERHTGQKATLG